MLGKNSDKVKEQDKVKKELRTVFEIFEKSECSIRPHFILTGPSGSGKSHIIASIAEELDLNFIEINAAQLTKEGTAGNSLSKALGPVAQSGGQPTVVFVDEFDKLFISGNTNCELAHETTNGVQNEFLTVLESDTASIFGEYGKYLNVQIDNVLFVFAGAFNGQDDITIDNLREFGVKTEFLGRVGLVFNTQKVSLESMLNILDTSSLLDKYLMLFPKTKRDSVIEPIATYITANYEKNTIGIRMINTLINNFFIKGGRLTDEVVKAATFQKTMSLLAEE